MKIVIMSVFCLWAIVPCGIAQEETIEKKKSNVKPFYSVDANFGLSMRREVLDMQDYDARLSFKSLVYGGNFIKGVELKHYFKVGLGIGYLYYKQKDTSLAYFTIYNLHRDSTITHGIPLFLYLRSDFLDKKISPYIDFKIGNNFLVTKETETILILGDVMHNYGKYRLKNGLFLASNVGITFKINPKTAIDASMGYRCLSRSYDMLFYFNGQPYRKTGYTIADHQFLLNIGMSF